MIKKLPLLLCVCIAMAPAAAAQEALPLTKVCRTATPPDENLEIIDEVPQGENSYFARECTAYKYDRYEGEMSISHVYGSAVAQTVTADGTVYFSNPITEYILLSYITGTKNADGSVVMKFPQLVYQEYDDYEEEYVNVYAVPMQKVVDAENRVTYVAKEDMQLVLNKTDNGYVAAEPDVMLGLATYGELADLDGNPTGEQGYAWLGFGDQGLTLTAHQADNGITPPAGVNIERWVYEDPYEKTLISVALNGDEIYLRGIDRGTPSAWLKGTVADGKVTIPSKSFVGINPDIRYFTYLWGSTVEYDEDEDTLIGTPTDATVFAYDPEARKLTLEDGYAICSSNEHYFLLTLYTDVEIYAQNRNVNTLPAVPYDIEITDYDDYFEAGIIDFSIPNYDVDDNLLETDRLFYTIYFDDKAFIFTPEEYPYLELSEPTQNLPYSLYDNYSIFVYNEYHTVYFYPRIDCKKCGIQTVYLNEEGKELRSEIAEYDLSGVSDVNPDKEVAARSYYNLQGQPVAASYKGLVICRTAYTDGTVKVTKTIRR